MKGLLLALAVAMPVFASAEPRVELHAVAGPHLYDGGVRVGAGLAYSIVPAVSIGLDFDHSSQPEEERVTPVSSSRRAARRVTAGYLTLQLTAFPRAALAPHVRAGLGRARFERDPLPEVEGVIATRKAAFLGGGLGVRFSQQVRLRLDAELTLVDAPDDVHLELPLTVGLAFRF
jgi:hypothetical protein